MRGLTAWERFILQRLASDPPDYIRDVSNEPREYFAARASLKEHGRVMDIHGTYQDGSPAIVLDISPKGREALRLDAIVNMVLV